MGKLRIDYNYSALTRSWTGTEILSCKIVNQCDPSGLTIPASTLEFELLLTENLTFNENARFRVYFDNVLLGTYYSSQADTTIGKTAKIKAYDCLYYIAKSEHNKVLDFPTNGKIPSEIATYGISGYNVATQTGYQPINACYEAGSFADVLKGMYVKTFVDGGWNNSAVNPVKYSLAITSDGQTGLSFKRQSATIKTISPDVIYRGATIIQPKKVYMTTVKYGYYKATSTTNKQRTFRATINGYMNKEIKTSVFKYSIDYVEDPDTGETILGKPSGEKQEVLIKAIDQVGNFAEYLTCVANSKTWKGDILWNGERLMDMVKVIDDNGVQFEGHIVKMTFNISANTAKCGLEVTYPRYYVPPVKQLSSGKEPTPVTRIMVNHEDPISANGGVVGFNIPSVVYNGGNFSNNKWTASTTYADYPFQADIPVTGCTENHMPFVTFLLADANSGNFAPIASSGEGYIRIYCKVKPSGMIYAYCMGILEGSDFYKNYNKTNEEIT